MKKKKSVIVLGAGLAGLRAASVLNERGYYVIVIERSPMAGGCTSSWIDNRDSEKRSLRKGQMQMVFPFYENLFYFIWKEHITHNNIPNCGKPPSWTKQQFSCFTEQLDGFYFADENGKRMHLTDAPQSAMGRLLKKFPAPLSALQILIDFDGFPSFRDKLSAIKFHALALLFGDKVTPPINDDFNFYGLCRSFGMTHDAIKAFRRITYSITNLSDADQVGPKFMHLFYLAYLRDKNILGCRMLSDDCNPALIDPIVASLTERGVKFRFNCNVRDILVENGNCIGIRIDDHNQNNRVICANCGLQFPINSEVVFCSICGYRDFKYKITYFPQNKIISADYIISALQPHQLASLYKDKENHPLRMFPKFRALGQFKGAALTVSRIFLNQKVANKYNLTGLDRDYYSFNGAMDIGTIMRRYNHTSVFDTLSDDGEALAYYPVEVLKARILNDLRKTFPETRGAEVRQHLLAHIAPEVLYHRIFPRLDSRFLLHSQRTPLDNFFLAGDWTDEYQIGMEAAIKSGVRAANCVLEADGRVDETEPIFKPSVAPLTAWFQNNPVSRFIKNQYEKRYRKESPPRRG